MKTRKLRTKTLMSFFVVIAVFGLSITILGFSVIKNDIIERVQDKVKNDLNSAREVYSKEIEKVKDIVRFTALRFFIKDAILTNDAKKLRKELEKIRKAESLDILTLTDKNGQVIVRSRNPSVYGDNQAGNELVNNVLSEKKVFVGTVILPKDELTKEGTDLAEQAYMRFIPTQRAKPSVETEQTSAMSIKAAAPITYDQAYMKAFNSVVLPLIEAYKPDVIVFELGADTFAGDPLAHLQLTNNTYADIIYSLLEFDTPILMTGGGGYHIENTVRAWALAWSVLCGADAEGQDANVGLGGVMLESTDWHGGLRDRQLLVDSRQQDIIVQDINTTIEKIKTNVFPFHGL